MAAPVCATLVDGSSGLAVLAITFALGIPLTAVAPGNLRGGRCVCTHVKAMRLVGLALGAALAACSPAPVSQSVVAHHTPAADGGRVVRTPPAPAVHLVRWHGPVEQLFVHPLVLRPQLAFTADTLGQGFQHYFVTAREFRLMLDQLWRNRWTLVDPRAVADGDVVVPVGRRPLVLQEDDVNYYDYFRGRGLASRLVLVDGEVEAEYDGRLTTDDVVPLVDAMVAAHPEFSAGGAKGLLALTAYEGFFGEHDVADPAARARIRALAAHLRATGWVIASHTYGHIDLSRDSLPVIQRDTERWLAAAKGLLGPTHILVYPFGARPSAAARTLLRDDGFTVQYDIDVTARRTVDDGVTVMSRRHVDGYSIDGNAASLAPFFNATAVRDPRRP